LPTPPSPNFFVPLLVRKTTYFPTFAYSSLTRLQNRGKIFHFCLIWQTRTLGLFSSSTLFFIFRGFHLYPSLFCVASLCKEDPSTWMRLLPPGSPLPLDPLDSPFRGVYIFAFSFSFPSRFLFCSSPFSRPSHGIFRDVAIPQDVSGPIFFFPFVIIVRVHLSSCPLPPYSPRFFPSRISTKSLWSSNGH